MWWILNEFLVFCSTTYTVFNVRLVGWEFPLVILGVVAWTFLFITRTGAACYSLYRRFIQNTKPSKEALERVQNEGVSIVKPLRGVDKGLRANLKSFFKLDYPKYEILFSVDNENDAAVTVVKELITKHPEVDARLIISKPNQIRNPKISNMITSYYSAKYALLWQSDSNIIVEPQILKNLVYTLDDDTGIVHQLPATVNPHSLVAKMEMCYISTWHDSMYLFLNLLGGPCVVGKSLLFRKKIMDAHGGLEKYGDYLAEDYFVSLDFWNKGLKLRMSPDPSYQNLGSLTLSEYWYRQVRWTRLRYSFTAVSTYFEIFTSSIANGLFTFHTMYVLFGIHPPTWLVFHFFVWLMQDFLVAVGVYGFRPFQIISFFPAWILRELLSIPLMCHACLGDKVVWRGRTYRLLKDSTIDYGKPHDE